jgi:pimeloyl-ACP methyl ester carboxylesterase
VTATFSAMRDVAVPVPEGQINVWQRPAAPSAETAVLVHGLSGNSRWWSAVIEHLPTQMGVIALDVRGRAGSVDAPPPYDLATIADDITRVLDHLDIPRAVVAGYSMGGWVAALFAAKHAIRAQRIILVDGGLPMSLDPGADPQEVISAMVGPSLRRLDMDFASEEEFFDQWKDHPALAANWDETMRVALGHELVSVEEGFFRVRASGPAIEIGAREITVGEEANLAAAGLEIPTHVIVVERGTLDQPGGMIPRHVAEELAESKSNVTMEYLPGLNHYTLVLGSGAAAVASAIAGSG